MQPHTYSLDSTWRTLLRDLEIAPGNVLRRAGLPEDLMQRPAARLNQREYYALWSAMEQETGDPLFALRICRSIRSESFSPLLFAALCSPSFLLAIERVTQYKRLIAPMRLDIEQDAASVSVSFGWLEAQPAPPPSLVMLELLFCVLLARMGTREPLVPLAVTTSVSLSRPEPYEQFLGIPLRRGTIDGVTFSRADAMQPFLTANELMWSAFEPELRQRLSDLQGGASTTERVRAALLEALPAGGNKIDAIASRLAVSKRTLQRRMDAEGSSFQQVMTEVRASLARHYLEKTALPPTEIAFLLGFDEPNSFYRAFRQWTGKTPDSIRHRRIDANRMTQGEEERK